MKPKTLLFFTRGGVNYSIKLFPLTERWQWFRHIALPPYHDGRGKYVSICVGWIGLYRGY
jgi:hypothetical protein